MSTAEQVINHLANYKIKNQAGNRYRFNSPFRAGADGMTCSLVIHDDEHGAWKDHKADEGGSLYDLADRLGIETPQQTPPEKRTQRYTGLADYAAGHGVELAAFEYFKWQDTTRYKKRAIEIPTRTGTRYRMLEGDNKFLNPEGYKACLYGLNSRVMQRIAQGQPLVYANGEASVVVAQHLGLAAFTVAGGGEKPIPTALLDELLHWLGDCKPGVIVALDSDAKGAAAALQVRGQLAGVGLDAVAVDLNLWNKGDLADFCSLHCEDPLAALMELPELTHVEAKKELDTPRRWKIIHAKELAKLPPIEWIIPGEIPDRGITVLYGTSGAGKSFFGLDCALKVAQKDPVVYMAGEGEYGYRQRVAAWTHHNKLDEGKLYMCLGAVSLLETDDLQAFLESCIPLQPRMVVVDTLARSMVGADENSSRDMGFFIRACEEIKQTLGCAVLVIHHTNKQGIVERGSGALRGASDSMICLSSLDDVIVVESTKTKDAQPFPTRYMKLLEITIQIEEQPLQSAVIVPSEKVLSTDADRLTTLQRKVLDTLTLEVFQAGASRAEIEENTQIPTGSLSRIMSTILKLGYVSQAAAYQPYQITDKGRSKIESGESLNHRSFGVTPSEDTNDSNDSTDLTDLTDSTSVDFEGYAAQLGGIPHPLTPDEPRQQPLTPDLDQPNDYYTKGY